MFSSRTPARLTPNPFTLAVERRRRDGAELLDLTESNPTRAGIEYPEEALVAALADPRALAYEPDPRGMPSARRAVVDYYAERGVPVDERNVILTASTSEAYGFLFKVLGEPGDDVLVPVPSYPLFEHLARVEALEPRPYSLELDGRWRLEPSVVGSAAGPRTRAAVVVSPNNPTGSVLTHSELAGLVDVCGQRGLPLVCDEVFGDYVYRDEASHVSSVAATSDVLTFTLNGLSKVAGLPQMKVGWIVVNGPAAARDEAIARLEFVADLFLSVATPQQRALPALLAIAPAIRERIRERVLGNLAWLEAQVDGDAPYRLIPADGGWYASLRVPRILGDEELAIALVERESVAVHPGYFFDFPLDGVLVVSLLTKPDIFREGAARVLDFVDRLCSSA